MEEIKQQLSQIIQNNEKPGNSNEAESSALKEIILSGLSRSGFLKEWPYLPEFYCAENNKIYLPFLHQTADNNVSVRDYMSFAIIELSAFGYEAQITENESGVILSAGDRECVILIINEDFGLLPSLSYRQIPIPYELRFISDMKERTRRKIELMIGEKRKGAKPENKAKPKKTSEKNKRKKKGDENSVQQLSLFDF